jgi:quercetin dioxygenase-like cupin family protein
VKCHYVAILSLLLAPTLGLAQAPTPVPVVEEPYHHVKLKNDQIVVLRVTLAPGQQTGYHIHSCNRTGVELTKNTTASQRLGNPEDAPQQYSPGDVFSDACDGKPLIHRVRNAGDTTMDVIDVELLERPEHPSTAAAATPVAENPSMRAYRWVLAPGSTSTMHTHTRPYLIVAVTPMQLKMTAPDGQSLSEEVKAGDFHWVNVPVTHSLGNTGATEGQILEFELK